MAMTAMIGGESAPNVKRMPTLATAYEAAQNRNQALHIVLERVNKIADLLASSDPTEAGGADRPSSGGAIGALNDALDETGRLTDRISYQIGRIESALGA